jgi:TPP-dependent pyruvate/acetoin dehydrogenase alpha subunit
MDGSVVWNGAGVNPDYVISDGIVAYATTMRDARDLARAGARPLIIEAVSRHETPFPSDPYVDDEDAEYILRTARQDGYLKDYRVIFVIGR